MKTLKLMIVFLTLHTSVGWAVDQTTPYLYVLGVVQDAGYPQAGCYAAHCMPGWQDPSLRRGAASIGLIDPQANKKYLFEATPNLPEQLYQLELQAPAAQFSLAGILGLGKTKWITFRCKSGAIPHANAQTMIRNQILCNSVNLGNTAYLAI